jgi:hypothetical protein
MPANPVNPIYVNQDGTNVTGYNPIYHQQDANGSYSRAVRVTASSNSTFLLTGSYANNAAFLIMNTGSVILSASNGQGYIGADFHEGGQNHQIFPIQLSRVSASDGGDMTVLYY